MGKPLAEVESFYGGKEGFRWETIGGERSPNRCYYKKLTTFYGNAIRANSHNVNEMRQLKAQLCGPASSTDDEPKHWFYPKGKNSWCKYNVSVSRHLSSK
ncbi:hypothetical protein TNCV_580221 [Trichonephila clavipes]|nr:hypothetical protein TNCV_580221 [Trichonephila clavipes]